jgi:hypothetical protein
VGEQLTGLRRIGWIRVVLGAAGPRAEAVGQGHRHPSVVPVPLATATRLAAAGIPLVVHDDQPAPARVGA